MFFHILLGFFTAFFALAFALLHLLASLSEVKKGNHTLGNTFLLIGSSLDLISHPLLLFTDCRSSPLADRLWFDLLRGLLEWETQRKLPPSPPPDSGGHRSGPYHLVSLVIRKAQVFRKNLSSFIILYIIQNAIPFTVYILFNSPIFYFLKVRTVFSC